MLGLQALADCRFELPFWFRSDRIHAIRAQLVYWLGVVFDVRTTVP